jgi:NADH:ubiquinone oxidoreductase subunit 5 (subunit L)/multisubunit Na+/H+ antiporter MnhA subunit
MIHFTFFGEVQSSAKLFKISHEGNLNLLLPLILLLLLSIILGYNLQFTVLKDELPVIIPNFNKFLPFYLSISGGLLSLFLGIKLVK